MNAVITTHVKKNALIAAAGTGGHIFPGLAIAEGLINHGWNVVWLGTTTGMENRIIPQRNIQFESIEFSGVRGKGLVSWLTMPFKLLKATVDSCKIIARTKPDVVVGFGGYVSLPVGLAAKLLVKKLVIHEQNSVIGLSNKVLSYLTKHIFTAFPNVIRNAVVAGNPLRAEFVNVAVPELRFQNRSGPLRILIIGGSLGAKFLNQTVPAAIKLLAEKDRPLVMHQSGSNQFDELQSLYSTLNVNATVVKFIDNTANAFADADLIICRAGASTVMEITAVGAAAIFVPLPSAVDDHQTKNAKYLVDQNAAWLQPQNELTPEKLAGEILNMNRNKLLEVAITSKKLSIPNTVNTMVKVCEELTQ
jgi:UDP-N-acetylglucosamine--N-acetylmuramyl-(pentapeptide) pyrophosphoryl-undecaprenol N-acetylglucosamine transferase